MSLCGCGVARSRLRSIYIYFLRATFAASHWAPQCRPHILYMNCARIQNSPPFVLKQFNQHTHTSQRSQEGPRCIMWGVQSSNRDEYKKCIYNCNIAIMEWLQKEVNFCVGSELFAVCAWIIQPARADKGLRSYTLEEAQ